MKRLGNPYLRVLLLVAILWVWEEAVSYFAVPTYILPAPSAVGHALWRGVSSLVYVQNLWVTVLETVLGFIAGAALAFLLGTVLALSRKTEYYCYPLIIMFQSLPKVALAPLIVIWFGLGLTSKVINAALIGAIVAEFVGATQGLGVLMESLNFSADVAGVFSILFILSMLGLLLNQAIAALRRRVLFWDASMKAAPEEIRRREIV